MKKIKIVLLVSLLVGISAIAMTSKVEKPIGIKQGTSIGEYRKPGAPVDITYTTEHVEVGDESKVSIVLTSSVTSGTMEVVVNVDKNLNESTNIAKDISFDMSAGEKEYPIELSVSAEEDGLYYVRLLVSIKDRGMRAFAVPVYVGDEKLYKKSNKAIKKTANGENISVSQAVETIKK